MPFDPLSFHCLGSDALVELSVPRIFLSLVDDEWFMSARWLRVASDIWMGGWMGGGVPRELCYIPALRYGDLHFWITPQLSQK